jgi:prevent-host-death family protein
MRIAPVADVKARLSAYLDHAQSTGPVVITRNGKAVAVLIAPRDEEDLESMVLSRSPRFVAMLQRGEADRKAGRTLSAPEFWKTVKERSATKSKATKKRTGS